MPQNTVEEVSDFDELAKGVNAGNCALIIDTLNVAFDIEVKGFKQRSVDTPENEIVIKGPHEAFVENIRTNTSLLRRIVNNEDLIIENLEVGTINFRLQQFRNTSGFFPQKGQIKLQNIY